MPWSPDSEPRLPLRRVAERPRLFVNPGFVPPDVCAELSALVLDDEALAQGGVTLAPGDFGASAEVPCTRHPQLMELAIRLQDLLGLENHMGGTLRLRRYAVGQGHPGHVDTYTVSGFELVATALVCVQAPTQGGETLFPDVPGGPVAVPHVQGQLVAWHNVTLGGLPEQAARHVGVPVAEGQKVILGYFFYASLPELALAHTGARASDAERAAVREVPEGRRTPGLRGFGRLLALVDDGVPKETISLLKGAADSRGLTVVTVDPRRFDFQPQRQLRPGDLLFRPAVSSHAMRVEQHLWVDGVSTFYRDPEGPLFSNINATLTFSRAGLPVPRTYWIHSSDRNLLKQWVQDLGGLPVVVKALGHSRGVGVIRADTLPGLFGIVDYALAEGTRPLLTAYVPDAVHWRVVVVGDRGVSTYRNVTDDDDFRSSGSDAEEDYRAAPPPDVERLAVAACHALRHDHGGVDILEGPERRLYVLEANFPCYYATAQLKIGTDVAGAMVDHLLAKAGPPPVGAFPALVE